MNKLKILLTILVIFIGITSFADENNDQGQSFVLCNAKKTYCSVGKHSMSGNNIVTFDGIICNKNMLTCSNGVRWIRSNYPISIPAKFVLCTKGNKVCTIGEHMLESDKPLFIRDGIVCFSNRKTCSNGFRYIKSSTPLF